jgi:hypothetical protein
LVSSVPGDRVFADHCGQCGVPRRRSSARRIAAQESQIVDIRREMKESEQFVTHFLQNLTIVPASLFLQSPGGGSYSEPKERQREFRHRI